GWWRAGGRSRIRFPCRPRCRVPAGHHLGWRQPPSSRGDRAPRLRAPRRPRCRGRADRRRRVLPRRCDASASRALRSRRDGDGNRASCASRPHPQARALRCADRAVVRRGRWKRPRPAGGRASDGAISCTADRRMARGTPIGAVTAAGALGRGDVGTRGLRSCGVLIAVAMLALAFVDARERPTLFVVCAAVAGTGYIVALFLLGRVRGAGTRGLAFCLLLGAVCRVPWFVQPPRLSSDVYRYVWDGRLQRLGEDPYRVVPDDPTAAALHTPATRQLDNGWVPSPYPPGAQLFFRVVTEVEESARAMKVAVAVCDALVVVVVLRLLAASGQSPWWSLAYAWNPLVAIEGAGNAHVDLLGTLALVVAAWAIVRRWRTAAALAFAFAIAVKFIPVVLAPLFWGRVRLRDVIAGTALLVVLYLPFVHEGRLPEGSLRAYLAEWRFNGPFFAALRPLASPTMLAGLALLAGLLVATWARARLR